MSKYTPTTAHVRSAYRDAVRGPTKDTGAEFDRWLAGALADTWDEGVIDGVWNEEHAGMIERGIREVIVNPYRVEGEGKNNG